MDKATESKILAAMLDGHSREAGFAELIKELREPLYWHVRRIVVSHEDAQDILQECFISVHRNIEKFKGESTLKTWIYRIATNEALRHCTRNKIPVSSYDEHETLLAKFNADSQINFETMEAKLQRAILRLAPKQQAAFNMRYFDQMSYEEIAPISESNENTVKTNYHYAAKKIKEYILSEMED